MSNVEERIIEDKSKFIEIVKEYPVILTACKKANIARATFYRWFNEDRIFKQDVKKALKIGVENINDIAEDNLVTMIVEKDLQAMKYWLQFHHKDYSRNGFIPVIYAKGNK